jgi:hypothetical protein
MIRGSDADEYLGEPVGYDPSERQPSPNEQADMLDTWGCKKYLQHSYFSF